MWVCIRNSDTQRWISAFPIEYIEHIRCGCFSSASPFSFLYFLVSYLSLLFSSLIPFALFPSPSSLFQSAFESFPSLPSSFSLPPRFALEPRATERTLTRNPGQRDKKETRGNSEQRGGSAHHTRRTEEMIYN